MRRTMLMVRRLVVLAFAAAGLLGVASGPAHAGSTPTVCTPNCCPWQTVQAGAVRSPVTEAPEPQYCDIQHCEPVLGH